MELKESQTSQLQTAATCSKSITPVVQPRYPFDLLSMLNSRYSAAAFAQTTIIPECAI